MSQSTPSREQEKVISFPFKLPHNDSDSHSPEILLSALLEYYMKSRLPPGSGLITGDMFSKLSATASP